MAQGPRMTIFVIGTSHHDVQDHSSEGFSNSGVENGPQVTQKIRYRYTRFSRIPSWRCMKILLLLVPLICCVSLSRAGIVLKDTLFVSPDKSLQANIDYHSDTGADQVFLRIRNLQTHTVQECGPILTPVHSVIWSPDSMTIVVIQHMANGRVPGVAHLSGGVWRFSTIYLPITGPARYSVTKLVFIPKGVRLTYRVAETKLNGTITGYEVTGLDVDASDFSVSNNWTRNTDQDTFESSGQL
jgi:hypothetical protein